MILFPLIFLTPNFAPRQLLARPMEIAATFNPLTYVMEAMRSLVLEGFVWDTLMKGFVVFAAAGAVMIVLNVQSINNYD